MFLWLLEREEGERGRETLMWERNIDRLSPEHASDADQTRSLTSNWTHNLLAHGMMLQPTELPGQGKASFLIFLKNPLF